MWYRFGGQVIGILADQLLVIGTRCEDAFGAAIDSILSRDTESAIHVVEGDAAIDKLEVELEEEL